MNKQYAVVDLFAGPGGLSEGFASFVVDGFRPYRVELSAEKEEAEHQTLTLRTFLHECLNDFGSFPDQYYDALNHQTAFPDWSLLFPDQWEKACRVAQCLELGAAESRQNINQRIDDIQAEYGGRSILLGGPPCQAYSLVGRARNRGKAGYIPEQDHRHYLYREYIRILDRLRPAVFVMENVKGILSSKLAGDRIFPKILEDLRGVGEGDSSYRLATVAEPGRVNMFSEPQDRDFVVRMEEHGVPEARHRVIVVGIRKDIQRLLTYAEVGRGLLPTGIHRVTVRDTIGGMPPRRAALRFVADTDENWREVVLSCFANIEQQVAGSPEFFRHVARRREDFAGMSTTWGDLPRPSGRIGDWLLDARLRVAPQHGQRKHMDGDIERYLYVSLFQEHYRRSPRAPEFPKAFAPAHRNWNSGKFVDRFHALIPDEPSSTITSHISKDGHFFIHPDPLQARSISVREAARLQTFPDNYFFMGNRGKQYHQVGNAVPPYFAWQLAKALARSILS